MDKIICLGCERKKVKVENGRKEFKFQESVVCQSYKWAMFDIGIKMGPQ